MKEEKAEGMMMLEGRNYIIWEGNLSHSGLRFKYKDGDWNNISWFRTCLWAD